MTELVLEDLGMSTTDYLQHHGILGQKWGRKQGPPYPLDPSDHSASEKKAGWRQSLEENRDKVKAKVSAKVSEVKSNIAARKEAKAEEAAKKYEEEKQRIINSGDYKQIEKIKDQLSTNELNTALARADSMARLDRGAGVNTSEKSKKELRAEKAEAKAEAKKEKIIESGDLNKIAKIQKDLDRNEIERAISVYDTKAKLEARTAKKTPGEMYEDFLVKANTIMNRVQGTIGVYNKVANTMNLFLETEMPVLDKSFAERKKAEEKEKMEKFANDLIKSENKQLILANRQFLSTNQLQEANRRLTTVDAMKEADVKKQAAAREEAQKKFADSVIRSVNPDVLEREAKNLTTAQYSEALNRIDNDRKLRDSIVSRNNEAYTQNNVFNAQRSGDYDAAVREDRARSAERNFYDQAMTENRARDAERKYFSEAAAENARIDFSRNRNQGAQTYDDYEEMYNRQRYDDD